MRGTSSPVWQPASTLAVIGMGLFFSSISLGGALTSASKSFAGAGKSPALLHLAGVLLAALLLALFLRKGPRALKPLAVIMAAGAAVSLALPLTVSATATLSWQFLLAPAVVTCACLPVGFYLFVLAVPRRRLGLALGCAMAGGELMWLVLAPLLDLFLSVPHRPEPVLQLYQLLSFCLAGMAGCFAAALILAGKASGQGGLAGPQPGLALALPCGGAQSAAPLLLLFCGKAAFCALLGQSLGEFPKTGQNPEPGLVWLLLLLAPPAVGGLLDRWPGGQRPQADARATRLAVLPLPLLFCMAVALYTGLGFWLGFGLGGGFAPFGLAVRDALFLAVMVFTARLVGHSPFYPLFGAIAWSLIFFQILGMSLPDAALKQGWAAVVLSLACMLLLAVFFRQALAAPRFWPVPRPEQAGPPGLADAQDARLPPPEEKAKLQSFVLHFRLTRREQEVLCGILDGRSLEDIRAALGISNSTVRFHQTGLFKKTGQANRRRLFLFYQSWTPDTHGKDIPADAHDKDTTPDRHDQDAR